MNKLQFVQKILETLSGFNNIGSSKRMAAAIIIAMAAILDMCYAYSYVHCAMLLQTEITSIHTIIVNQWEYTLSANFLAAASCLGITYFDKKLDTKKEVEIKKSENNSAGQE